MRNFMQFKFQNNYENYSTAEVLHNSITIRNFPHYNSVTREI